MKEHDMADTAKKATAKKAEPKKDTESKPKAKRRNLTHEERIAKLQAELAEARNKASQAGERQRGKLTAEKAKLEGKRDELTAKIDKIDEQFKALGSAQSEAKAKDADG